MEGDTAVFVDVDPVTGALDRRSVEQHIHTGTRRILLEPLGGILGPNGNLAALAEPRDIVVEIHREAPEPVRRKIVPGLWSWGSGLVEADAALLSGGAEGLRDYLERRGVASELFQLPGTVKRKDFPGACRWMENMLRVAEWSSNTELLRAASVELARQLAFDFGESLEAIPAKMAGSNNQGAERILVA